MRVALPGVALARPRRVRPGALSVSSMVPAEGCRFYANARGYSRRGRGDALIPGRMIGIPILSLERRLRP
jgi:hypothetical protein